MLRKSFIFISVGCAVFSAGFFWGKKIERSKKIFCGTLRIDKSVEDEPENMFLELETSMENLASKKEALFLISKKNYICRDKNNSYNGQK